MPRIPEPKVLLEIAHSANRIVEDREWKKYRRYLSKLEKKSGRQPSEKRISFEDYLSRLTNF